MNSFEDVISNWLSFEHFATRYFFAEVTEFAN